MDRTQFVVVSGISLLVISGAILLSQKNEGLRADSAINVDRLESYMQQQVDLGYRIPGSEGSAAFMNWIVDVPPAGWDIEIQNFTYNNYIENYTLHNYFITHETAERYPSFLFGAHYDSRAVANRDPDFPTEPVPGANDGASGVAAILEMLHHLDSPLAQQVGFVLFDAEDQGSGGMTNFDWIIGSTEFASAMTNEEVMQVRSFVLFDMIANDELIMRFEKNSNSTLNHQIWDKAENLGYGDIFLREDGPRLTDDHIPFRNRGIPSVDLIDFYYPEWHTVKDNMQHVSAEKAAIVLDTTIEWLKDFSRQKVEPDKASTSSSQETQPARSSGTNEATFLLSPVVIIMLSTVRRWSKAGSTFIHNLRNY